MTASDARMRELLRAAPNSLHDFLALLYDGLDWPLYEQNLEPEDLLLDWSPEELHLDPALVARLAEISQIPPLTAKQKFGAFYLRFEGGQLPIGAIRRLVQRLVTSKRGKGSGKLPSWTLDDLLFFCLSDSADSAVHVVTFRERDGKRVLRVLSWSGNATDARLNLLVQRSIAELQWASEEGPRVVTEEGLAAGFAGYREGIRSAKALSRRMAEVAQDLRDEVEALLAIETATGPMRTLYEDVRERLIGDITRERFADVYAQTMVYGLLTARIAHPDRFKAEQSLSIIKFDNEFLDAIYLRFRDEADGVIDVDELGLADLAEALANTDVDELLADFGADNQRDDPVVYFYEEFLAQYDPQQRKDLGAFYTPKPVVRYIVKTVDDALKSFGLPLGVADSTTWSEYVKAHPELTIPDNVKPTDPVVSMFDPANGTGTFLVEWLEQARKNAGAAGVEPALRHASALEISLASYAISHLKVSLDLPQELREKGRLPIFLGDTLGSRRVAKLTGMDDPVGVEGVLANHVKFDRHHNVVIGNPPYDRVESQGTGGFVTAVGPGGRSLFDDILDSAKQNTIFSHHASLYNLYIYFWRWSIWKALEQNEGPAVISMITGSSWLTGPGFIGLRKLVRKVADEVHVLDLHGDGLGAVKDENVFDIQSPVAIVTLIRRGKAALDTPAVVNYTSIKGTRAHKLEMLSSRSADGSRFESYRASEEWHAPFTAGPEAAGWRISPRLVDLLPHQTPGVKFNRTWPIAPDPETLRARWQRLLGGGSVADRARCFVTPKTGRNITTKVAGLARIVDLEPGAPVPSIARYGYRSFDRQYCIPDPRVAALERPALWAAHSESQVYMTTLITKQLGSGPSATVSAYVPDLHYYNGRGGKDVVPLYRDAKGTPNADPSLLRMLSELQSSPDGSRRTVAPTDLFAYVYGVLAGANYSDRFKRELERLGPRIPLSADPDLFDQMARHGSRLLWLQTFGERYAEDRNEEFPTEGVYWRLEPTRLPADKTEIRFNPDDQELLVADGVLVGLSEAVYSFEVSGMPVITKWLGYRQQRAPGKAASSTSPLDGIRPATWHREWSEELVEIVAALRETTALLSQGVELLDSILGGPLVSASELPVPPDWMRKPSSGLDSFGVLAGLEDIEE
jgi:hypothetical protein